MRVYKIGNPGASSLFTFSKDEAAKLIAFLVLQLGDTYLPGTHAGACFATVTEENEDTIVKAGHRYVFCVSDS